MYTSEIQRDEGATREGWNDGRGERHKLKVIESSSKTIGVEYYQCFICGDKRKRFLRCQETDL